MHEFNISHVGRCGVIHDNVELILLRDALLDATLSLGRNIVLVCDGVE